MNATFKKAKAQLQNATVAFVAAALSLCWSIQAATAGYVSAVLADNPLAYWRLGDGDTYLDSSGNSRHLAEDAGAVADVSGILPNSAGDGAVQFSGGAGRLVSPGFEKIGAGGYSIEYWIKVNTLPTGFTNLVGDGVAGGDFFMMNYLSSTGIIRPHYSTSNAPVSIDSDTVLVPGQTYHIVTSWDATSGTNNGKIWINGVLDKQINVTQNLPAPATTGDNPVYIGRDNREPALGDFVIDEVAVYNYALSPTRVVDHAILGGALSASTVLSTDVLGPGTYGNGYNNNAGNSTVELVRFIPNLNDAPLDIDYNQNGDTIDLAPYVVDGPFAGNLGSDIHGRGAQLFLPGDGESLPPGNNGGIGLGAHANWLITFDLEDIRSVHLYDTSLPLRLTGRFGMNGQGGVGETVDSGGLVQGLIYLDGEQVFASNFKSTLDLSDAINLTFGSGRWLTLAIVNGNGSTFYDDGSFRDMVLTAVPEPSSLALLALGLISLKLFRRRN